MTHTRWLVLGVALGLSALAPTVASARSRAGWGEAHLQACAAGYHADAQGNCQPNFAQEDRFCPRGAVFHVEPWGWDCDGFPSVGF